MFSRFSKQIKKSEQQSDETNYARGVEAEERAKDHLISEGYQILEQRYKTKFGEVDVIAIKDNILCFIEVKMRQDISGALEAVTARTRKRIEQSALDFMMRHPEHEKRDMRFDVIAITKPFQITHLENAWQPES